MSPRTERAFLKSARQFHAASVTMHFQTSDEPRRYDVALDPWDNIEIARREMQRGEYRRTTRRTH